MIVKVNEEASLHIFFVLHLFAVGISSLSKSFAPVGANCLSKE